MTIGTHKLLILSAVALLLGVRGLAAEDTVEAREYSKSAPDAVKESLSTRVNAFYDLFRAGKFRDAEAIVSEPSRDLFYGAKKNRIISYQIESMEFADDFKFAKALVTCKTIIPMMGSEPFDVPLSSEWRWQDSDWFMHFQQREATTEAFQSPFGPMTYKDTPNTPGHTPMPPRPTLDSLRDMVRADRNELRMSGSQTGERSISVHSQAAGPLTLSVNGRLPPGLEVETPEAIESGSYGDVRFVFTPGERSISGRYQIELMVLPINQILKIFITF